MKSREQTTKGKCTYCGQDVTKNAAAKHLAACTERQEVITKINNKNGKTETLYHLRVQSVNSGQFWLDLEMRGSATLKDLDSYLRAIWLECCGHMSKLRKANYLSSHCPYDAQFDAAMRMCRV